MAHWLFHINFCHCKKYWKIQTWFDSLKQTWRQNKGNLPNFFKSICPRLSERISAKINTQFSLMPFAIPQPIPCQFSDLCQRFPTLSSICFIILGSIECSGDTDTKTVKNSYDAVSSRSGRITGEIVNGKLHFFV